jgi:hypothetical protein
MKAPISTAIAVVVGVLVLLGYFVSLLAPIRVVLLQWAVILAAFALIVGVVNLVQVHWLKVRNRQSGSGYSVVLIFSLFVTILVVLISGPTGAWSSWIFNNIQLPVETSLLALLAIVLAFSSARMLRRRPNALSIIFFITTLVVLLGSAPLFYFGEISWLSDARNALTQVGAVAGARGILLGVALGTIATGVRILMGVDRPYGG